MTRYAENTSVTADRSRAEIDATLSRYGATQFIADPRFIERTVIEDRGFDTPCWVWTGHRHDQGYGRIYTAGRLQYVHRLVVEAITGIPQGWTVDHLCRVTSCWHPEHLEAVTRGENVLRGMAATAVAWRQRTCTKGHPMCGDNLYTSPKGQTQCRACRRVRHREQARRRRAGPQIARAYDAGRMPELLPGGAT